MKINEMIYSLRKENNLSQEELADKLNVSRQTVSKWELGESCPDFNKIVPLCDLFGITTEELLRGKKAEDVASFELEDKPNVLKALLICISVFLYFLAVASMVLGEEYLHLNEGVMVFVFFVFCGLATSIIVFTCIAMPGKKKNKVVKEKNPVLKGIISIVTLITTLVYLLISFLTMAWHITWVIWIIYTIVVRIIQLVFYLKEDKDEE